jgi:mercuric ion binding protein
MVSFGKHLWAGAGAAVIGSPIVVRKASQRLPGVSSANVDFALKTATVTFDPDRVKPATLTEATTNAGFPSTVTATP